MNPLQVILMEMAGAGRTRNRAWCDKNPAVVTKPSITCAQHWCGRYCDKSLINILRDSCLPSLMNLKIFGSIFIRANHLTIGGTDFIKG